MKKLSIIIPTRGRYEKLMRCLDCIPIVDYVQIIIVCDNDKMTYANLKHSRLFDHLILILIGEHKGSVYCRNQAMEEVKDGIVAICDDMDFRPGMVKEVFDEYNFYFPNDDGVLGLRHNYDHHPSGTAIVGKEFLKYYPDKQLFYPRYYQFAAQEIHWLASKLNKFQMSKNIIINHHHPCFEKDEMDITHTEARKFKKEDMSLIAKRQKLGLIWGWENGE